MKIVQHEVKREKEPKRTRDVDHLIGAKETDKDIQEEIDALEVVEVFDHEDQDHVALKARMNGF
jgi:hypothetical protein